MRLSSLWLAPEAETWYHPKWNIRRIGFQAIKHLRHINMCRLCQGQQAGAVHTEEVTGNPEAVVLTPRSRSAALLAPRPAPALPCPTQSEHRSQCARNPASPDSMPPPSDGKAGAELILCQSEFLAALLHTRADPVEFVVLRAQAGRATRHGAVSFKSPSRKWLPLSQSSSSYLSVSKDIAGIFKKECAGEATTGALRKN